MTLLAMILRSALLGLAALVLVTGAARAQDDGLTESPDGPEHIKVYATRDEALGEVFADADTAWTEDWTLADTERSAVEARLGLRLAEDSVTFHRARHDGRDLGWALELEEKGRFKPITFMVHVEPDLAVGDVIVMVYRESRGDGVRRGRFLNQFEGKTPDSRLRLDRDVTAISGATMSSRALAAGVKRALVFTAVRYGDEGGTP